MAGDGPSPIDDVAAAFARLEASMHAVPLEARHHQPAETWLIRSLGTICNGLLVLGILLAIALSTYAFLGL